jgi:hypothetical protein
VGGAGVVGFGLLLLLLLLPLDLEISWDISAAKSIFASAFVVVLAVVSCCVGGVIDDGESGFESNRPARWSGC